MVQEKHNRPEVFILIVEVALPARDEVWCITAEERPEEEAFEGILASKNFL